MPDTTDALVHRVLERIGNRAIIPDDLVIEVQRLAGGRSITESIVVALKEWTALRRFRETLSDHSSRGRSASR